MLSLNTDCLFLIFDKLDIDSHISLMSTCTALRNAIENYYSNRVLKLDHKFWKYSRDHQQKVAKFLAFVGPHIKEVVIEYSELKDVQLLERSLVEKITSIHLSLYKQEKNEEIAEILNKIKNNLRALSMEALFNDGILMDFRFSFPKLIQLKLTYCKLSKFNTCNFPELKELALENCIANDVNFSDFKNLTKLKLNDSIWDCSDMFVKSFRTSFDNNVKCEALEELKIDFCPENSVFDNLLKLKKLRKMEIECKIEKSIPRLCNRGELKWKTLILSDVEPLKMLVKRPERLIEVHNFQFTGSNFITIDDFKWEIPNLLKKCKNLRIIKICSWLPFDLNLLEIILNCFGERKETLYIGYRDKYGDSMFSRNEVFPAFVKPFVVNCDWTKYPRNSIICEWTRD